MNRYGSAVSCPEAKAGYGEWRSLVIGRFHRPRFSRSEPVGPLVDRLGSRSRRLVAATFVSSAEKLAPAEVLPKLSGCFKYDLH